MEVRVAIIGNVDSGKSTMVGVLTRSMLDDGRGLARSKVFKHNHEEATGRTSSIGQHNLCVRHSFSNALFPSLMLKPGYADEESQGHAVYLALTKGLFSPMNMTGN